MTKRQFFVALLSAITVCDASTALAGNRPGAVTLTLGSAYYHFAEKRHLDNSVMPNVALAYDLTDRFAFEASAGNISTNFSAGGSVHAVLYTIDGLYRFTPKKYFEPYVIAGVGVMNLKPAYGTNAQYQSNINAGLGTQFFADKMIALRGEVRDLYTLSGGKNDIMVNFGLSFVMGG